MLTFFLLIGRYLDFKARESARSSAHDLLKSFQGFAKSVEEKDQHSFAQKYPFVIGQFEKI